MRIEEHLLLPKKMKSERLDGDGWFEIGIRHNRADDEGVILGPWRSQIKGLPPFFRMPKTEFDDHMSDVVEATLDRCGATMATHPDHDDQVFGWVCGEMIDDKQVLHFAYVRGVFRNHGIGGYLLRLAFPKLKQEPLYFTHMTRAMKHYEKKWNTVYQPYLARSDADRLEEI